MHESNLYELLQIQPSADPEIIQAAYRRLMLRYHPDRNPGAEAQEMSQRLNRAYEILSDPDKRAAYDRENQARPGATGGGGRHRDRGPATPSGTSPGNKAGLFAKAGVLAGLVVVVLIVTGVLPTSDLFDRFSDGPEKVEDLPSQVVASAPTDNGDINDQPVRVTQQPENTAEPPVLSTAPPIRPATIAPIAVPSKPALTKADIFLLESAGEITATTAVLLLKLEGRGLGPTLDAPGVITAVAVAPTQDACLIVECDGGTIPSEQVDEITFSFMVEPVNPALDQNYIVRLADTNEMTLNAEPVRWSIGQLEPATAGDSSASPADDAGRVKAVTMTVPFDHPSMPAFVEDFNQRFLQGLEEYEDRIIIECDLRISRNEPLPTETLECFGRTIDDYRIEVEIFADVLAKHFTIDLMLESEFLERGLNLSDQPLD